MASPRGVLSAVALLLGLFVGVIGWNVRSEEGGAVRAEAGSPPAAAGEDPPSLEPPRERAREGDGPSATPEDLTETFEKRYRGFDPKALSIAHDQLARSLQVRADEILRAKLKAGAPGAPAPEIDYAREESTRDLYLEIAWLAARLPEKE